MTDHVIIEISALDTFLTQMFEHYGFPHEDAAFITETLIDSDRRGIASHGLQRVALYENKLHQRTIDPAASSVIATEALACAVIDGHDGIGQLISRDAMDLAIRKANEYGIGMVAVRGSNHFGAAGIYARMAADQGLIGVVATNSFALVVPTHANVPALGSNPLAFAVGSGDNQFVFDAATCTVSLGKIEILAKTKQPIPGAWAVDEQGDLEHDAGAALTTILRAEQGGLTPLGGIGEIESGHKGYGLGLMVEILTSVLSAGISSLDLKGQGVCHWFTAVKLDAFGGPDAVTERLAELFDRLRALPSSDGQPVIIPGDKERAHEALHTETLSVDRATYEELRSIAERLGLAAPDTLPTIAQVSNTQVSNTQAAAGTSEDREAHTSQSEENPA